MQVGNSYNLRFELIKQDGGGTNILKEIIPLWYYHQITMVTSSAKISPQMSNELRLCSCEKQLSQIHGIAANLLVFALKTFSPSGRALVAIATRKPQWSCGGCCAVR